MEYIWHSHKFIKFVGKKKKKLIICVLISENCFHPLAWEWWITCFGYFQAYLVGSKGRSEANDQGLGASWGDDHTLLDHGY